MKAAYNPYKSPTELTRYVERIKTGLHGDSVIDLLRKLQLRATKHLSADEAYLPEGATEVLGARLDVIPA